jgi:hypothetical protein
MNPLQLPVVQIFQIFNPHARARIAVFFFFLNAEARAKFQVLYLAEEAEEAKIW